MTIVKGSLRCHYLRDQLVRADAASILCFPQPGCLTLVPKWVILHMLGDCLSSYTYTRRSWGKPRRAWMIHPGGDADREQRSHAKGDSRALRRKKQRAVPRRKRRIEHSIVLRWTH